MEGDSETKESQEEILNRVLNALFYEDGDVKDLTHNTLKLVEDSKPMLSETDALLVEGLLRFSLHDKSAFKVLSEAEQKGCDHPLLYHGMACCYERGRGGAARSVSKALEYFDRVTGGGNVFSYLHIYRLYYYEFGHRTTNNKKGFNYLLDLEREGYVDGSILTTIANDYRNGHGCAPCYPTALEYYQRAKGLSYATAYWNESIWLWKGNKNFPADRDKALLVMLEAERKGLIDDGSLSSLIIMLPHTHTLSDVDLGPFRNEAEMALHYCDVLIQKRSPEGYYLKGRLYWNGFLVDEDKAMAMSIWEEADRLGLANMDTYLGDVDIIGLSYAYMQGIGVKQNGAKALEYCVKGLEFMTVTEAVANVYRSMAEVYARGIHPIKSDRKKAEEIKRYIETWEDYPSDYPSDDDSSSDYDHDDDEEDGYDYDDDNDEMDDYDDVGDDVGDKMAD